MTEVILRLPTRPAPARGLGAVATDVRGDLYGPLEEAFQTWRAAEIAGLDGVLAPDDPDGEEPWTVAAGVLRAGRHLRAVAEFPPSFATPVYAAKLSATLQRAAHGRLGWKVAVGGDPAVRAAQGDPVTGEDALRRAHEFLTVAKGVWHERPYTFEGDFYRVLGGGFGHPLAGRPFPTVYLSGTTPGELDLSAAHADVHLLRLGDDVGAVRAELDRRAPGRAVRLGVELSVSVRHVGQDDGPPEGVAGRWDGFASLGHTVPEGLVGTPAELAAELDALRRRGVTTFVVEARPALAEAYRLGEHLLPALAGLAEEAVAGAR
ncbi:LLM class flavin-dependent oxidoreductase [Nocardiopsis changdeensis]|uniref:LLM class flavin-dependent oxidoreductase n=1 Tax=Nocardiopsis changdeensis TaxID=2831969 RepID=A0ABX8BGZ0_9ACTN|nr:MULTISPECIES: LLM class flavin-dependent oxidoreductase [Nocardiopsis]QUX21040.1 LLM class flavin-dependent oxidoreductase [Nocardiopsis changdeensis]QYX36970.1 LLM class flavin-dependent oxidoreductase [Nocardiopsis sp. MT53]